MTKPTIKVVRCVDAEGASGRLTEGRLYCVKEAVQRNQGNSVYSVIDDSGEESRGWFQSRFVDTPDEPAQPSLAGDSAARKQLPMFNGLLGYFPNACAYVSHVSKVGNDQHNPGEPMYWAFDKSIGSGDEIVKHLAERGTVDTDGLLHTGKAVWRALELLERELLAGNPNLKPGVNVKGFKR